MFTEGSYNDFKCMQDLTGNMSHQNPGHGHIRKRGMPPWESTQTDTQNRPPSHAYVTAHATGGPVQHAGGQVMIDFSGGAGSHVRPHGQSRGQPAVSHPSRNQSTHTSNPNFDAQPSRKRQSSGTTTEAPAQKAVRPSGMSQAAASTSQDMRSPGSSTGMKVKKYVFFCIPTKFILLRFNDTTVDLETLEPHIIANYTIIRQRRPTLLHTSVRNDQCDLSH